MGRWIQYVSVGLVTSFYFFPIGFSFLPGAVNTKMVLAVLGLALFGLKCIQEREVKVDRGLCVALVLATLFSLISYLSTDINQTQDYAYATYFVSLSVWLGAAFAVGAAVRAVHGEFTFRLLTFYLAAVCVVQCVVAVGMDTLPTFQLFIDQNVQQGQEFFKEVDRLYGIGAALDPAGVRFSLVLVMIVALLCADPATRKSKRDILFLLVSFFVIAIIGNVISRTTILGLACASVYFILASGLFRKIVYYDSVRLGLWFGAMLLVAVAITSYLYQTNEEFYGHMRFAFEGFFNWVEHGTWRTDSTDKLNQVMWIWPEDLRTWIIGSGLFDGFIYHTDIGYCRFILYCGLTGFSLFAFFFVYLAYLFSTLNPQYWLLFICLLALTFLIWIKVATDIFQLYALFFCLDQFTKEPISEHDYEISVQH